MNSLRSQVFGIILLVMTSLLAGNNGFGQSDPFEPVVNALKQGNAKSLAATFNTTIDLGLPEKDNSYSKSQAEMVLKDFFRENPPTSFIIDQKGKTDELSHFAIGTYNCHENSYQVYIQIKNEDDKFLVNKIKFELKK